MILGIAISSGQITVATFEQTTKEAPSRLYQWPALELTGDFYSDMRQLDRIGTDLERQYRFSRCAGVVVEADLDRARTTVTSAGPELAGWRGESLTTSLGMSAHSLSGVVIGTPAEALGCYALQYDPDVVPSYPTLVINLGSRLSVAEVVWRGRRPVAAPILIAHRQPSYPLSHRPDRCSGCGNICYNQLFSMHMIQRRFPDGVDEATLAHELAAFIILMATPGVNIIVNGPLTQEHPVITEQLCLRLGDDFRVLGRNYQEWDQAAAVLPWCTLQTIL